MQTSPPELNTRPGDCRAARAVQTYVADPADPLLGGLLQAVDPCEIVTAIQSGTLPGALSRQLACGPYLAYPREHAGLFDGVASHGAVVSEYRPGSRPPGTGSWPVTGSSPFLWGCETGDWVRIDGNRRSKDCWRAQPCATAVVHAREAPGQRQISKQTAHMLAGPGSNQAVEHVSLSCPTGGARLRAWPGSGC
jgi:hypothetical protein